MEENIEEIVLKAKEGKEDAKNKIYTLYKPLVRSICQKHFQLGGEREDLLQEGMIGLFDAVSNFDAKKGNFTAFASLCIKRRVYTSINKANTEINKQLFNALPLEEEIGSYPAPEGEVESSEMLSLIKRFMQDKLSLTERTVTEYILAGYSHSEICHLTAKSYKSVDAALQRARKKLAAFKENL